MRNRISVRSVAGSPSLGSCWVKVLKGSASDQTVSSTRPSISGRWPSARTADRELGDFLGGRESPADQHERHDDGGQSWRTTTDLHFERTFNPVMSIVAARMDTIARTNGHFVGRMEHDATPVDASADHFFGSQEEDQDPRRKGGDARTTESAGR